MDFATLIFTLVTLAACSLYGMAMILGFITRTETETALESVSVACDVQADITYRVHTLAVQAVRFALESVRPAVATRTHTTLARPALESVALAVESTRRPASVHPVRSAVTAVRRTGESNAVFAQVNGAWILLRARSAHPPAREIVACDVAA